jgi:diguanylate cyclase (GGDEF)-like protein
MTQDARRRFRSCANALALGATKSACEAVLQRIGESAAACRVKRAARVLPAYFIATVRRRSLISEILALQLFVAVVAGGLAFGGLWWASSSAVREHMRSWGAQWLDNLGELDVPQYAVNGAERNARVQRYLHEFSEILFVRYYSAAGEPVAEELPEHAAAPLAPLAADRLETLLRSEQAHLLDTVVGEMPVVRIAKPIWATSVPSDKVRDIEPSFTVEQTLVGYVEMGLDFSSYRAYEIRAILRSVAVGMLLLVALTTASWLIYRRALRPLAALQVPLKRLAHGHTNISVTASGHREIAAVANALNASASALTDREQRLSHLASRDELTGLPNRQAFQGLLAAEMEAVAASGRTSALLCADLDQFKYVNDSLGVAAGDRVLKLAADWFRSSLRPGDVVARFSGDSFGMLLRDVSNKEAAAIGAELVKRIQSESFREGEGDRAVNIRCSIGATMVRGTRVEPAKLVNRAERACYQAKLNGRNQFCFYNFASRETAEMTADAGWSQKIQKALKEDAFVLHYQPIVSLRTRDTVYYEVLLRMVFDEDELAFPATFLPTAARLGLMVDIDRWVIRQALRSLAALRFVRGDVRFTLNVSGSTFDRPDFFSYLETELRSTGVPLEAIVIEITEQTAMRNLSGVASRMSDLVGRGCRFAIDDFGSGYCSYSYLKNLPLSFVKIDGSFIANLAENKVDQKIVAAIAEVAAAADCETIAEHVTDYETLRLLEKLGVEYAQGYFLGKPSAQLTPTTLPLPMAQANRRIAARRADSARARRVTARKAAVSGESALDVSDDSSYL